MDIEDSIFDIHTTNSLYMRRRNILYGTGTFRGLSGVR